MSSTKSRDGPRGGGGGGGPNKAANKSTSNNKTDLKADKSDLNPKMMPTAEQMQIARIIDTHRVEDPELQKKIRQVMDITRTTEDEACKALHSREYDIEQAITLLVEGDSQSEWEEARRKKKVKTPGQKAEAKERAAVSKDATSDQRGSNRDRDSRPERPDRERKDSEYNQDGSGSYDSRGRGGGRGFRGGRGRGARGGGYRMDNKENDELNGGPRSGNGFVGRYSNGPSRGGRGGRESGGRGRGIGGRDRDRDGTRTFASRAREPREGGFGHHPIDVWENSQADAPTETLKVDKWDEFPSAEDWDNEEYTGSLAESKVFTPSTQASTAITGSPLTDTNSLGGAMLTESTASDGGGGGPPNHIGTSSDLMSLFDNASGTGSGKAKANLSSSFGTGDGVTGGGGNILGGPGVVVAGQSIDLSILLQKPTQNSSSSGTESGGGGAHVHAHSIPQQPVGGGINSTLQMQQSYSNATQHGQVQVGNGQPLPPRNKSARPARGPPTMSKILPWGGQMPDDPSLGTLGSLFADMEFRPSGSGIPSSGVEMPDDSSVSTLDVQFGGMEFGPSGSAFNSVTQQSQHHQQAGGDMMYSSNVGGGQQSAQNLDYTIASSASGDKDGQGKSGQVQSAPTASSPFQGQRNNQQQLVSGESLNNSKTVPISPNIDTHHSHSTGSKGGSGVTQQQQQSQQHSQQQQHTSYNSTNTSGSAFVSYAAKGGAPGFPPVSQNQTGTYGTIPQGLTYGSPAIMAQQPQPTYHNMTGMSSYGAQPLVAAAVQHNQVQSHTIPSQSLSQGVSSATAYGVVPPNPYQNPHSIPGSATGYMYGSNQYSGYGQSQKPQNSINTTTGQNVQLQSGKDSVADASSMSNPAAASAQIGTASNLASGSTNTSSASSTPNSKISGTGGGPGTGASSNLGSSTTGASSKISTSSASGGAGTGIPPGMVPYPQYIVNQSGVPLYGFQAPLYGYDENSVQFLPRLPHPTMTSYYDPTGATYTQGGLPGSGRSDGSSLQTYAPGNESRFARSDSSTASPVPSNITGQATQPMYNPVQGYYYVGNNMIHPGAFPYGPPQMFGTGPMPTPTNQSSGAPHGGLSNHQYQNKPMYGSNYIPYDSTGQPMANVTDFVSKQQYSTGSGGVGGGAGSNSGKGSTGSSVNNSQTTDLNSYKGHPNKPTSYDKTPYLGNTGTMYSNQMGQQGNAMAGAGGLGFGVYLPPQPVLQPPILLQDGNNGQRQVGGQPKPGKQQFGNQQYWGGN